MRVLVIGGGVGGIAAALDLAEAGASVTLLERTGRLGGKSYSFPDPATGADVDNGQHVLLPCFTEFLGLLDRLGTRGLVLFQDRFEIRFLHPGLPQARIGLDGPYPWGLLPSLLRFPHLSIVEKFRLARAIGRLRRAGPGGGRTFLDWLRSEGRQSERAVKVFWDVLVRAALNAPVEAVELGAAVMVFQESLLRGPAASRVGIPTVGLSRLIGEPALRLLREKGVAVRFGSRATALRVEGGRVAGASLRNGEEVPADAAVAALPLGVVAALLPEEARRAPFFAAFGTFRPAPIIGVHLFFDRPVADFDFAAVLGCRTQWIFDKGRLFGAKGGGYLSLVLSGAFEETTWPRERILETLLAEVRGLLPAAREARLIRAHVLKEPAATFLPDPAAQAARPPFDTPIPNLFLGGVYPRTGWPATMEGAVRGGRGAAAALKRWNVGTLER